MAPQYAERYVTAPDRTRLFVRDYAGAAGEQRVPVMCLHGLTRNSADFEGLAPDIAQTGRRVLALDVRGRGRSDRDPDPTHYRPDIYARDVLLTLDELNVGQAIFVGTSMGGLITMLIAAVATDRVRGVVLNDVGPVVNPAGLARIGGYLGNVGPFASWQAFADKIRSMQSTIYPRAGDEFWNIVAHRVGRELSDGRVLFDYDPAIAMGFSQPAGAPPPDLQALFMAMANKPILVLRGGLSDILAREGVEVMQKLSPGLRAVEVPDVGHAPTLDEPISRDAIREFLAAIP
jgi:pimeloyl-ACP methyl ester carboxylesterase